MKDELQNKLAFVAREKGKYGIAFAAIAAVLLATGLFSGYVLVFLGVTGFFIWKAFAPVKTYSVRGVFEFYLAANEILRDDDKRWFGFEMQEVLHSGEKIVNSMPDPPPLVLFTLGALQHKIGNYETAAQLLGNVLENEQMDENRRLIASPELKNYVRILRRIEREPAEAPQTSAAVRALERARRNRGAVLLEDSRKNVQALKDARAISQAERENDSVLDLTTSIVDSEPTYTNGTNLWDSAMNAQQNTTVADAPAGGVSEGPAPESEPHNGRKPITEVLKDIYGR